MKWTVLLLLVAALSAADAEAQARRPLPDPVTPPAAFEAAVEAGTRTRTGRPGDRHWTNTADYTIRATFSPEDARIRATETVRYRNASPDTLRRVAVHLRQNLHREGAVRNREVDVTGGMHIRDVTYGGRPLGLTAPGRGPGYVIRGTVMHVLLPEPIAPGATVELGFAWHFDVPRDAPRMGHDGETFFIAYWYPQLAVYDDVHGWVADQYLGDGEYYMGFGDYDVEVAVPEGWLVAATGELANAEAVLSPAVQARLDRARRSRDVVRVVAADERGPGRATRSSDDGVLTWRFTAADVRDFAFGTSAAYVWDAVRADAPGRDEPVVAHAFYRPRRAAWRQAAAYEQFAVEYLSELLSPYPYPQTTAVEGVIPDGMEFPMITHMGALPDDHFLFFATFHEVAHNWFPMRVGSDEKRFAWMDEGLITFATDLGRRAFWGRDTTYAWFPGYLALAGRVDELPSMRHADAYPHNRAAASLATYLRPATALHALRHHLGEDRFLQALRTYDARWTLRHPYPYDFFNTVEDVAGEDLDWFWTTMLYETWALDHAVADVRIEARGVTVVIEDRNLAPMPAPVRVTYGDGSVREQTVPVDVWLGGAREATLRFPAGDVVRVDIDPAAAYPDVDRTNNAWTRPGADRDRRAEP